MQLIPAIDLKQGRCVRLYQGDFERETRYAHEPQALLAKYSSMGAHWVHVVDLDGADGGSPANSSLIAALSGHGVKLQVGGGLRDFDAVERTLKLGAARVVIGSAAVTGVNQVREWMAAVGPELVVLAFDVRIDPDATPCVATHGWRRQSQLSLWEAVSAYDGAGLRHVLCTDVNRDGALTGPNVPLYAEAAQRFPAIRWQASGGIRDARDLHALAYAGAAAAVSGKALLDDLIPPEDLQPFLPDA